MFHMPKKGDPPGQLKQWIRCCMHCEYVYISKDVDSCPKCEWPSYGAPFVYGGWLKAIWRLITQKAYRKKQ